MRGVYPGMRASDLITKLSDDFPDRSTLATSPNWSDYEVGDIRPLSECAETVRQDGRQKCSAGFLLFNMKLHGNLTWQDQIKFSALNGVVTEVEFQQTTITGNSEAGCASQEEAAIGHYTGTLGAPTSSDLDGSIKKLEWNNSVDNQISYTDPEYEGVRIQVSCTGIRDTSAYVINLSAQLKSARAEEKAKRQVSTAEQNTLKL